jgi:hypothetical protein
LELHQGFHRKFIEDFYNEIEWKSGKWWWYVKGISQSDDGGGRW